MSRISRIGMLLPLLGWSAFAEPDLAQQAQKELFAARYEHAIELYRKAIEENPAQPDVYYGLVRALLRAHHATEAYDAADLGVKNAPQMAGTLTAKGMAMYRYGDILKSQDYFVAALKVNPKYAGALVGLSELAGAVSKFKRARELELQAYQSSPDDPALMTAHANTLKGAEHIAALEQILAIYDPASHEARALRAHIASDRALGDRKARRMTSPYEASRIKLVQLWSGPSKARGVGVRVKFNGKESATLLLDTGASGISLSPKAAEKAGLELLSDQSSEMNGIGDERSQDTFHYIAAEVRAGNVTFAEYPVSAFRSAKTSDFDGLIGADVFQRFLVSIDFPKLEMDLEPRPASSSAEPEDPGAPAAGFYQAMRMGNHMAVFTDVNSQPGRLFLIDSGSNVNLIDTTVAREVSKVWNSPPVKLHGVQGTVKKTSLAEGVTLTFAGFRQDNPEMLAFDMNPTNDSMGIGLTGILGMPVLTQLRLTIDYRSGTVRMEHNK